MSQPNRGQLGTLLAAIALWLRRSAGFIAGVVLGFVLASLNLLELITSYSLVVLLTVAAVLVAMILIAYAVRQHLTSKYSLASLRQELLDLVGDPGAFRDPQERDRRLWPIVGKVVPMLLSIFVFAQSMGWLILLLGGVVGLATLSVARVEVQRIEEGNALAQKQHELGMNMEVALSALRAGERIPALVLDLATDRVRPHLIDTRQYFHLDDALASRVVALSQTMQPYRLLVDGELGNEPHSPQRGQLLMALHRARIDHLELSPLGADFSFADLTGQNLSGGQLRGVVLRQANLQGADLQNADLRGADLTGADVTKANLRGTLLQGVIGLTPKQVRSGFNWTSDQLPRN